MGDSTMAEIFNNLPLLLKTATIFMFFGLCYSLVFGWLAQRRNNHVGFMPDGRLSPVSDRLIRELVECHLAKLIAETFQQTVNNRTSESPPRSADEIEELRMLAALEKKLDKPES
jgi:hypothetical protein